MTANAQPGHRPASGDDWKRLVRHHAATAGVDLQPATVDELAATEGVGPATARIVYEHLHDVAPAAAGRRAG